MTNEQIAEKFERLSKAYDVAVTCDEDIKSENDIVEFVTENWKEVCASLRSQPVEGEELARLRGAMQGLLDAMDMQEKREAGRFDIPGETMLGIWRDAQAAALAALSPKQEGGRE
jgi:hypothetical protein